MRKNLLLTFWLFLFLVFTIQAQIKYEVHLNVDGKAREFILSVPTTPPPAAGYPLVMMLHGTSGDMNVYYNTFGWKELGQQENFVTLFPSSLKWCFDDEGIIKNNFKFVCGDLVEIICPSDTGDLISDVQFFRTIIDLISDTVAIDTQRIFGSGFSNGCCMILKVGMEAGDLFKSVAGTSGNYHALDSITPDERVPIWFMVGTLDDRYIVPPYTELPFGADSILGYLNKVIVRTLASQGLTTDFTKQETLLTKTYLFNTCQPGVDCAPYVFTLIKELGHQYPNGVNHVVDAPALFWDFFNNPPGVTLSTENTDVHDWTVSCFPNPTAETMRVLTGVNGSLVTLKVFSQTGSLMYETKTNSGEFELDRTQIGSGIFILHLESEGKATVKKLIFL